MTRTWVRVVAVLVAVWLSSAVARASGDAPPDRAPYVVRPGDTLWSISRSLVGPAGDPRPAVEAIREANALAGTTLIPGSTLSLPAGL